MIEKMARIGIKDKNTFIIQFNYDLDKLEENIIVDILKNVQKVQVEHGKKLAWVYVEKRS